MSQFRSVCVSVFASYEITCSLLQGQTETSSVLVLARVTCLQLVSPAFSPHMQLGVLAVCCLLSWMGAAFLRSIIILL